MIQQEGSQIGAFFIKQAIERKNELNNRQAY